MTKNTFQRVRGMQDILPPVAQQWQQVIALYGELCDAAGYNRIYTPVLEAANLFERSVGADTEVVHKELYRFEDRGGDTLALKPESTAGVVRAYLENGLGSAPSPVNFYYIEPHFRYDRPQAGRHRQHHQLGLESFGVQDPYYDASVIALAVRFFDRLGLKYQLLLNTIGSKAERETFEQALVGYLKPKAAKLPTLVNKQLVSNPLRVLDSKDEVVNELLQSAPQITEYLQTDSKEYFDTLQTALTVLKIDFEIDPRLVRGLDYYNDTVFEFKGTAEGSQDSIGGGGRYDGLVELLGGKPAPAVGFGLGLERIVLELGRQGISLQPKLNQVGIITLTEAAKPVALQLQQELLNKDIAVVADFSTRNLSAQLKKADKQGTTMVVILGETELQNKLALVRNLQTGDQQEIALKDVAKQLSAAK